MFLYVFLYIRKDPRHDTIVSPSENALKSVANKGLLVYNKRLQPGITTLCTYHHLCLFVCCGRLRQLASGCDEIASRTVTVRHRCIWDVFRGFDWRGQFVGEDSDDVKLKVAHSTREKS
jgi:hypothetical protein